jgi:hypothetical protein
MVSLSEYAARIELDKGRAHRAEAKRRVAAIEGAKEAVDQAKGVATSASEKLTSAKAECAALKETHAALVARFQGQAAPAEEVDEVRHMVINLDNILLLY